MKIGIEIKDFLSKGVIDKDDQAGVMKRQNSTSSLRAFISASGIKGIGGKM